MSRYFTTLLFTFLIFFAPTTPAGEGKSAKLLLSSYVPPYLQIEEGEKIILKAPNSGGIRIMAYPRQQGRFPASGTHSLHEIEKGVEVSFDPQSWSKISIIAP